MPTVFLSYAREDLEQAGRIAEQLASGGVRVWRDQERVCVGQAWPKVLGEAIAVSDAVLLLWSSRSAGSSFVELEWCTALALKKTILPCLLDQTPLPPSLAAIEATEPPGIAAAVWKFFRVPASDTRSSDQSHAQKVVGQLAEIGAGTPAEVLLKAKAVFAQSNWAVQGPVYQAGGDIHIGVPPESLRRLLDTAKANIPWIIGVIFLFAAVSWQFRLIRQVVPSWISFARQSNEFHSDMSEGERVLRLLGAIEAGLRASRQIDVAYHAPTTLEPGAVNRSLRIIRDSREELRASLGVTEGTRFHEQILNSFLPGFQSDFQRLDAVAAGAEEVYSALSTGDGTRLSSGLKQLRGDAGSLSTTLTALDDRTRDFMQEASSLQRGWGLDIAVAIAREKIFAASEILFIVAVVYEFAFVLVAARAPISGRFRLLRSGQPREHNKC
jgi:hypothetical protein